MSDPPTDYRRDPAAPLPPPYVVETAQLDAVARGVRTALACLLGTTAAVGLGASLVLAVGAIHVLSPERPARIVPVLLAAPEVRRELARQMVSDDASDRGVPFTDTEREALVSALDAALASPELNAELRDLRPVGGRLDGTALAQAYSSALRTEAEGRPPEIRRLLLESADQLPAELEREGSSTDATGLVEDLTNLRRFALIAAAVLALLGIVVGAIALAVARRRPLTAVLVSSGALLAAVLALAPGRFVLEHLPGPLSIPGYVLAAIGELSGPGTLWTLTLAIAVPPAVWWALRSWRPD